jgi:hypothetical protein
MEKVLAGAEHGSGAAQESNTMKYCVPAFKYTVSDFEAPAFPTPPIHKVPAVVGQPLNTKIEV